MLLTGCVTFAHFRGIDTYWLKTASENRLNMRLQTLYHFTLPFYQNQLGLSNKQNSKENLPHLMNEVPKSLFSILHFSVTLIHGNQYSPQSKVWILLKLSIFLVWKFSLIYGSRFKNPKKCKKQKLLNKIKFQGSLKAAKLK